MYHPALWHRTNSNNYVVDGYQVQFHKEIWTCDCVAGTLKLEGVDVRTCKHVKFVKRKEEAIKEWQKEVQERSGK